MIFNCVVLFVGKLLYKKIYEEFKVFLYFRMEGKGKYEFLIEIKYEGDMKDGMFYGKGILFFFNGSKYDVIWENGIVVEVNDYVNFKIVVMCKNIVVLIKKICVYINICKVLDFFWCIYRENIYLLMD